MHSKFNLKKRSATPIFSPKNGVQLLFFDKITNIIAKNMFKRIATLEETITDSIFLFGARQTGKTTLINELFPTTPKYDLLDSTTYERLQRNPSLLRQELEIMPADTLVVIDEIQQIPILLNEVHWLIVNKGLKFVLSGSSARKLKRSGANMLGGRALKNVLFPLVSKEIDNFDVMRAIHNGMIPRHYLAPNPVVLWRRLQAYITVYLREEIKAEALVRNLSTFNKFLEIAAMTDGEMVVWKNIAQDCGIDAKTVKEYFSILEETLIGYMIPAYTKKVKRDIRQAPRFYYFDLCIPNYLLGRKHLELGTADFGHAFEHLMIQEIVAYLGYNFIDGGLSYWHTYSGIEVDAILGDALVAIEFKSCAEVQPRHLNGLKAFKEEHPGCRCIVVSMDERPRLLQSFEVLPADDFLHMLWNDEIIDPQQI